MTFSVILPTAEIIKTFRYLEPIFCFYDEGIKGLVRDTVLLGRGFPDPLCVGKEEEPTTFADGLLDKVIQDYENSVHLRYLENTLSNIQPSSMIEVAVMDIDQAIRNMMYPIFHLTAYDISKIEWQWLGDDLITQIKVLEERHAPQQRYYRVRRRVTRF